MKLTLLSTLLFISFTSSAQIKKGSIFLGGDISFNGNKTSSQNNTSYNFHSSNIGLSISSGIAIKENLIVGIKLLYSSSKSKDNTPSYNVSASAAGGGVWLRKYYPLSKAFYLFIDGNINIQGLKTHNEQLSNFNYNKSSGININLGALPGITYQMKKKFFLEASLNNLFNAGYSRNKIEQKDNLGNLYNYKQSNYGISSSIGNGSNPLQIGARWIISK